MKFLSITLTAFSITIFIFIAACIANAGTTNEIALGEEYGSGDWVISNTIVNSSEIIYLEGNLTVEANGNLTLDNVTLIFNCTSDGQYHIEIKDGGELHICDNSTITRGDKYENYLFWVQEGAKLTMENSSLSHCGYEGASPSDYGLYICSSNVLIRNCIIINNSHGISVGGRYYAAPYIANNTISNNSVHGIYCRHDCSEIINNTISYNGGNGIFCDGSYANIENNSLVSNYKYGIGVSSGSYIGKIAGNKIENSSYGIYCDATSISSIAENTISNGSVGIYCAEASVVNISKNIIKNLSSCGIHIIRAQSESTISWNNITECGMGIYCDDTDISSKTKIISHNIISNNTGNGIYCRYSSPVISENIISNNTWAVYLSCASATVDMQNNTFENNTEGILSQEWHLKVTVRVGSENIKDARVVVKNNQSEEALNETTLDAGYVDGWVAEYKILNDNNRTRVNCTPHTIIGYKQYVGSDSVLVSITDNTEDVFLFLKISDLTLQEISIPEILTEGSIVTIKAYISNNGGLAAYNINVSFFADATIINNTIIAVIPPQSIVNCTTSWLAERDVSILWVKVDIENKIEESNDDNNNLSLSINVNWIPTATLCSSETPVYTLIPVLFTCSYIDDGTILKYYFDFGDGTSNETTLNYTSHSYSKKDIYHAKVKVRDNYNVESQWSDAIEITVLNRNPCVNIELSNDEVNTNTLVWLIYSGVDLDGTIVNYTWEFGDGSYGYNTSMINHSYADNGDYIVNLTVRDDDGGINTTSVIIAVRNVAPTSNFYFEPFIGYVTTIFTFNASASYDSDGTVINYTWDFGDNSMGYGKIVTHEYTDDRNYTVKLTVRDNDLAEASTILILQILNSPPTTFFSLSKRVVFVNERVEFNATLSSDLDDEISNYTWNFDDGTKGYGMLVNHTYTQPGRYFVTLTVFDDEGNRTYTLIIEIKPLPTWIELHYKEVYLVGAIICIIGAVFFSLRWYVEAREREREVKLWAEKKGAEKEIKIEAEVEEWAEKKKKLKTIDERIREWGKRKEEKKKAMEEKIEEWAKKKEKEKIGGEKK